MINLEVFANDLIKDKDLEQINVIQLATSLYSNFELVLDHGVIMPENITFDFSNCRAFLTRHGKYSCFIEGKQVVETISFANYDDDSEIVFKKDLSGFEPNYTKSKPITNPILLEMKKIELV